MEAFRGSGEDRTGLGGVVADGDHGIEALAAELVEVLGALAGDVDPPPGHLGRGERVDARGLGAGARRFVTLAAERAEDRLGHLRAGAVVGAEEQDAVAAHGPRIQQLLLTTICGILGP